MKQDPLLKRVVIASLIGATVEWYDFFLYGVVAGIVFNQLYFPTGDPLISTLLAYTTFAVGFVARPLGGIIFGHFGDRIGRKSMLVLTLMIMGVCNVPDRSCSDLRPDRRVGADPASVPPHLARPRSWR